MSCLPAVVSLALLAAPVPVTRAADAATPAATTSPGAGPRPWQCGDNQAKYRPEDRGAQKYWREHTPGFIRADANQRIAILEAAWSSTKDPCFLYFLYRANERQGHYLQALAEAEQLQAIGAARTPPDVAEYVEQVREGSKDCDVELRLDEAAKPATAEVRATYRGLAEGDDLTGRCAAAPCDLTLTLSEPVSRHLLRVGTWTLTAGPGAEFAGEAAGEPADRRTLVVDHCGAPLGLTLRAAATQPVVTPAPVVTPEPAPVVTPATPEQPQDPPKRPADMRRLSNVGIGVGTGLVLAGGALLVVGAAQWSRVFHAGLADECNAADTNGTARCRDELGTPTALRSTGAGVFGAGAGVLLPAMILRRSAPARRAVWMPIVGGLATIAGAALVGVGVSAFNAAYGADSATPWSERRPGSMHLHTVGGALAGFGVGLLGSSLARCVWRGGCSKQRQATIDVAPARLPGGAGISFAGRF